MRLSSAHSLSGARLPGTGDGASHGNGHHGRHADRRRVQRGRAGEVQDLGEVARVGVAGGQRRQPEAPLDRLQHRGVVVGPRGDEAASRARRDHQRRHPEATQRGGRADVGRGARDHVVEEPAPLVEVDDQQRVAPGRTRGDRRVDVGEELLPDADVGGGVVVPRDPVALPVEPRVEEAHRRQRPRRGVGHELLVGLGDRHVLRSPQGEERDVGVVVGRADARVRAPVPDGRHRGDVGVVVQPVGPRRVLVEAVRVGLGHHGAEVAVTRRPVRRRLAEEAQVGLVVVADREAVVLAGLQPAVGGVATQLDPAPLVGVVRVGAETGGELLEVVGAVLRRRSGR